MTTRRRSILSSPWSCQGASRGIFSPGWHFLPGHELTRRAVGQASGHRAAAAGQPRVSGPGDQPACAHRPGRCHRLHPDVLWADEAVALLGALAGGGRVATDLLAAQEVARSCADLPLALRIAGARLASRPRWQVSALADRLADTQHRLDELGAWRPRRANQLPGVPSGTGQRRRHGGQGGGSSSAWAARGRRTGRTSSRRPRRDCWTAYNSRPSGRSSPWSTRQPWRRPHPDADAVPATLAPHPHDVVAEVHVLELHRRDLCAARPASRRSRISAVSRRDSNSRPAQTYPAAPVQRRLIQDGTGCSGTAGGLSLAMGLALISSSSSNQW